MTYPIVLIPARLGSTRLPDKPLADIAGEPMIVHVWRRAVEADVGQVIVATNTQVIANAVRAAGGRAVLILANHSSGSDRIFEALGICDTDERHDIIVNVQGDFPTISPSTIRASLAPLDSDSVDLATVVSRMLTRSEAEASSVVKLVGTSVGERHLRALYFTRACAPWGDGPLYHHIGVYAWRRWALTAFVALPPSPLEQREKLEQLRALEAGMRIDAMEVDDMPLGVDTPEDLEIVRRFVASKGQHRSKS
jgi:3-deoxy-manno-octulosonate cytidylyltransferase (CMP-KDO synthetase)